MRRAEAGPHPPVRWGRWSPLCLGALFAALWGVYHVAFGAPFYLDSLRTLVFRTNLHMVDLSWRAVGDAIHLDYGQPISRPLSQLSLAFTHYFAGLDPVPYRIGNVVIHWCASAALLFLFLSVLRAPRVADGPGAPRSNAWPLALAAVGLWSLHPIQTNAVTYVVQRMASLCGLFTFLGVGSYVRARSGPRGWSRPWGLAAMASLGLALASKETAAVALPLILAAEFTLLPPLEAGRARNTVALAALAAAVAALSFVVWKGPVYWRGFSQLASTRDFTAWERLLTQARLQANYLLVLLIPDPRLLTLDAEVAVSRSLFAPPATALMLLAEGAALALAVSVRRARPLLSFGILWFFLSQLLEGTILPLELYFEHRMYVPSAFLFLGLAWGAQTLAGRLRRPQPVLACLLAVALAGEGWATYSRNRLWADPLAFHEDNVAKAPNKARPHTNLGYALRQVGLLNEARREFLTALTLGGDMPENYLNLAAVAYAQKDLPAARSYLQRGMAADPAEAWKWEPDWAMLELEDGNFKAAFQHVTVALQHEPRDARTLFLLGEILFRSGQFGEAEKVYGVCLRFDPSHAGAWNRLGLLRGKKGESTAALEAFEKAVALNPAASEYRANLAAARAKAVSGPKP